MVFSNFLKLRKLILLTKNPTVIVGFFAFVFWVFSNLQRPAEFKRENYFLAPPKGMIHFTFGYSESMADVFGLDPFKTLITVNKKLIK